MWCSRADEAGGSAGSGAVDKDSVSGCGAVELPRLVAVLAVEPSTETESVDVLQSSCRAWWQCWQWNRRQRRRLWVWCSRADEAGGSISGAADSDAVSGCVAVELTSLAPAVVTVEPLTETPAVDAVELTWLATTAVVDPSPTTVSVDVVQSR